MFGTVVTAKRSFRSFTGASSAGGLHPSDARRSFAFWDRYQYPSGLISAIVYPRYIDYRKSTFSSDNGWLANIRLPDSSRKFNTRRRTTTGSATWGSGVYAYCTADRRRRLWSYLVRSGRSSGACLHLLQWDFQKCYLKSWGSPDIVPFQTHATKTMDRFNVHKLTG